MLAPAGTRLLGRASAFTGRKALRTPLMTIRCFGWVYVRFTGRVFAQTEPPHPRSPTAPPTAFTKFPENTGFTEHLTPEHPHNPLL